MQETNNLANESHILLDEVKEATKQKSQPKVKNPVTFYDSKELKAQSTDSPAKIVTRDGNEYTVNKGTIRAIKPISKIKKLSPSKLRRKLKRLKEETNSITNNLKDNNIDNTIFM